MISAAGVAEIRPLVPEGERGVSVRIVTSTNFDFEHFVARSKADEGPNHGLLSLAKRLDAVFHQPNESAVKIKDRLRSAIAGRPEHWALARSVLRAADDGDIIYCTGDDSGFPLALLAMVNHRDMIVGTQVVGPGRTRTKVLSKLIARGLPHFFVTAGTISKAAEMRSLLPESVPVILATQQTDTAFFRPDHDLTPTDRPLIVSCGLEQRDYRTLAAAVAQLDDGDVDVKVCVASPNKTDDTQFAFPEVVPDNMEMRLFEFSELRELYQRATVTVVPLLPNNYSAGLTTMMEAMACGSPVVMAELGGLPGELADRGAILTVPPNDVGKLRDAIAETIANPERAQERAAIAFDIIQSEHAVTPSVDRFAEALQRAFEDGVNP